MEEKNQDPSLIDTQDSFTADLMSTFSHHQFPFFFSNIYALFLLLLSKNDAVSHSHILVPRKDFAASPDNNTLDCPFKKKKKMTVYLIKLCSF